MRSSRSPASASAHEVVSRGETRFADVVADCERVVRDRLSVEPEGLPAGAGPGVGRGLRVRARRRPRRRMVVAAAGAARHARALAGARTGGEPGSRSPRSSSRGRIAPASSAGCRPGWASLGPRRCRCSIRRPTGAVAVASVADPGATSRTRWRRPSSASAPASSRRSCWPARSGGGAAGARSRPRSSARCASSSPRASASASARPEAAFLGASPELLVRRRGAGAQTVALAGSTRRSADPAVDDHLGEQLRAVAEEPDEHDIVVAPHRAHPAPAFGLGRGRGGAGADQGGEHPAPGDADPRPARRPALGSRARRASASDPRRRRRAARPGARGDRRARGHGPRLVRRARSAGWTPPRTATSASASARPCFATAPRTSSRATASSPTPIRRRSSPRPSSSSARCCRCSPADRRDNDFPR